jgi:hypothetical protein
MERRQLTKEEQLAEIMSLGSIQGTRRLGALRRKHKSSIPSKKSKRKRSPKQACESIPVGDDLTPLSRVVIGELRHKEAPVLRLSRNKLVNIPDDMFLISDIAEYLGIKTRDANKAAAHLGLVDRRLNSRTYPPVTAAQAKQLIQHVRLAKARVLKSNGVIARDSRRLAAQAAAEQKERGEKT